MRLPGIPRYEDLGLDEAALAAARRMEARAAMPASVAMYDQLVVPLVGAATRTVLEIGCGTAALARRIAASAPGAEVHATDKSQAMLRSAAACVAAGGHERVRLARWDATAPGAFPFLDTRYDLIVSSVMAPYLEDGATARLVCDLAGRLAPGGVLLFVEQDLLTDSLHFPSFDLLRRVYAKDARDLKRTLALGLRPLLRAAGLAVLPRRSYLWTDEDYGPYTQELLGGIADAALGAGRIDDSERRAWDAALAALRSDGDFYYGIVYHRIAARRANTPG
jgi:SAM-dependent methyltransferase